MRIFKVLALCAVTLAFGANAAIIENDDFLADSFKDTNTGLVWMDFGINNIYTYNEVVAKLEEGEEYEGWRLPDFNEVSEMWFSIINAGNPDIDRVREDFYGSGVPLYADANSDGGDDSVWDDAFDVMGFNVRGNGHANFDYTLVYGLFSGEDALYSVLFDDFSDLRVDGETREDSIAFNTGWNQSYLADDTSLNLSTLLVRVNESTEVPAPNSIAFFAVALSAFALTRRRRKITTR